MKQYLKRINVSIYIYMHEATPLHQSVFIVISYVNNHADMQGRIAFFTSNVGNRKMCDVEPYYALFLRHTVLAEVVTLYNEYYAGSIPTEYAHIYIMIYDDMLSYTDNYFGISLHICFNTI